MERINYYKDFCNTENCDFLQLTNHCRCKKYSSCLEGDHKSDDGELRVWRCTPCLEENK